MTNNDTLFTKVSRFDKKMKYVVGDEKGKKTRFEAKDILEVKCDTNIYESGNVRLRKSKQFILLHRTVSGKLNLYQAQASKSKILWKNFGYDFIRFRWVYKAQDWTKRVVSTVYFYRKTEDPRRSYSTAWKKKTQDCPSLQEKLDSRKTAWNPSPEELVRFYNTNCIQY